MKIYFRRSAPTAGITILILVFLALPAMVWAQPATVSSPVATGVTSCTGTTGQNMEFSFNSTTNTLTNGTTCVPSLATPGFSSSAASMAFNPSDGFMYYLRYNGTPNSYVWRWNPSTCPTGSLALYRTYLGQAIAGIAFDPNGDGWQISYTGSAAPYGLTLQKVNFATNTIGAQQTIVLPASVKIWTQTGDIVYSPSGQLYFVMNNKLMTVNHTSYGIGTLNATYIDTLQVGTGNRLVGLGYSDGKLLASIRGNSCYYSELNPLTGDMTPVTYTGKYSAQDLTSVISGIGAAKKLISATPTGTAGVYDLEYDVYVQNYGNVPDNNVQVTDNLGTVYGAGNVSMVSLSWVGTASAGFSLNAGYNGTTNTNLLTNPTPTTNILKNYPVAENNFTIRISCRVSGIVTGIVYNNSATVTATGYKGVALLDVSTNGSKPDLNTNDKADDPGESQPTPFIVNVAPETPPCDALKTVLYNQTFGTGTGLSATLPGTVKSQYTGVTTAPVPLESFTISNNANNGDPSKWINLTDHTGNPNGRMLLVNADVLDNKIFVDTVAVQCSNLKYSFFTYAAFIGNSSYQTFCNAFGGFKYPRLVFSVKNAADGSIITNASTSDITATAWNQYGLKFVMPAGISKVIIEIYNAGEGGCGNDLALDDIQFGLCDPEPTVAAISPKAGCIGSSTVFGTFLSDTTGMGGTLVYQWQSSLDGSTGWTDISGATAATYTITSLTAAHQKYYRVIVAQPGNIGSTSCSYTSNALYLNLKASSTAPASVSKNKMGICPGDAVSLRVNGGSLGTNAIWRWYAGNCGVGPIIGTGATITVNPTGNTTYYVRAEGDCNITACAQITVTMNCDLDRDKDGITDIAESGGLNPMDDDNFNGIENYRDPSTPGFVDINNDGIDDRYDADLDGIINAFDLDSDNDGIPDVVEAGGVDANGDGKLDNFVDTDGDGLANSVDATPTTGAAGSGNGLGLPDLDGDGVPNQFDLDSDNDGIPDIREVLGTDLDNNGRVDVLTDTDHDGLADIVDADVGNDGVIENPGRALLRTGPDINGDGRADSYPYKNPDKDRRPNPYDLDSDGDGITDVREAGFGDADNNGMSDGPKGANGWDLNIANTAYTIANHDTDPPGQYTPDYLDIDSDNDGIPDNIEGVSTSSYQFPLNQDSDNDGIDDRYDSYVGFGGNGLTPNDQDADGIPDYYDTDSDNDGNPDYLEGNDFNLNGLADDNIVLTNTDADGDGLDDFFDLDNTSGKGTSRYMGTLGTLTGDPSPGSRTMVQKSNPSSFERDWRTASAVLDINFLSFSGTRKGESVALRWVITSDKIIDHFEIERSTDGSNFEKIGVQQGNGTAPNLTMFGYTDNSPGANGQLLYYRVKAVSVTGVQKATPIIILRQQGSNGISLAPNPASHFVTVNLTAVKDGKAELEVLDAAGRQVIQQRRQVYSGSNSFQIDGVDRLQDGLYHVRVRMGEEVLLTRLVIQK